MEHAKHTLAPWRWRSVVATTTGRRDNNEDAYLAEDELGLYVVADGMGGYEGGEIASQAATEAMAQLYTRLSADVDATWPLKPAKFYTWDEGVLEVAIRQAHLAIESRRTPVLTQMGSTVVALVARDDQLTVGHVGDSRLYRLRDGQLIALTADHSFYEEYCRQVGKRADPREFAWSNIITRALGTDKHTPDVTSVRAELGDRYLLCSDGLTEKLTDAEIAELLGRYRPAEALRLLMECAWEAGTKDNTTAIIAWPML